MSAQAKITADSKLSQLQSELKKVSDQSKLLETEKSELEIQMRVKQTEFERKSEEEKVTQTELRSAVIKVEEAKTTMIAQQQNANGRKSIELEKLMAAAKKDGPLANAGLRGRLGDLGSISAEYDVAISTCCGLLDHIVVETTEGGQACINYLREKNIGRANFIVLNQVVQYKGAMERPITVPPESRRLFDLVVPNDPSLAPAFYMALKDTLVASDLDNAVKIAYEGGKATWRVVTLGGDLIDTSGSMSGGKTCR